MDEVDLITITSTEDSDGYVTNTEQTKKIFCTFSTGINRAEFYESMKAGIKLSATMECWAMDYSGETVCKFNEVRYQIVRAYETGRGTMELSLSEVIR